MGQRNFIAHARAAILVSVLMALTLVVLFSFTQEAPAAVSWSGTFETGDFSQWDRPTGNSISSGALTIVRSNVREGQFAMKVQVDGADCPMPGDKNADGSCNRNRAEVVRNTGEKEGTESWWAWSTYFPADYQPSIGAYNIFTQWHDYGCCANPPVSFFIEAPTSDPSSWYMRLRTRGGQYGPFGSGTGSIIKKFTLVPAPLKLGQWYDFVFHVKHSQTDAIGFSEVWVNGKVVVPKSPTATLYSNSPTSNGGQLFMKQGIYRGLSNATSVVIQDGMRRGTSAADVMDNPPSPTPDPTPPPPPPPPPPPSSTLKVTTIGLAEGDTVLGTVSWAALPTGATVDRVVFLIDGQARWTERNGPYIFKGDGGTWDTTAESNGAHTLTSRAYATDGRTAASTVHVKVANPTQPPGGSLPFELRTVSVAEGETVSGAVRWEEVPTGAAVDRVEFLIDDQVRWTDQNRPYVFNGNTGTWDTTLESEGDHTLKARAIATDGREKTLSFVVHVVKSPISFTRAPRMARWRKVSLPALAPPGTTVVATISGPTGRVLGKAREVAGEQGRIAMRIPVPGWRGQRPLYVALVSRVAGELTRVTNVVALPELAYVKRPKMGRHHTLRIRATALPHSPVEVVVVRGGRRLGVRHTVSNARGSVRCKVVMPRWAGQRRLRVVLRMPVFENGVAELRRVRIFIRLSARELERAR